MPFRAGRHVRALTDSLWRTTEDAAHLARMETGGDLSWQAVAEATSVRFVTADGLERRKPLARIDPQELDGGQMTRKMPKYKGRRNYSGSLFCVTGNRAVEYESLLERSRIAIADFDRSVVSINSQAMELIYAKPEGKVRSHYPDLFLLTDTGPLVVDVTSESKLYEPARVATFTWTAAAMRGIGWSYQVWYAADVVAMLNLNLLMGYRRTSVVDAEIADAVASYGTSAELCTVERELAAQYPLMFVKPAVRHAIWQGTFTFDMARCLQPGTWLTFVGNSK